MENENAVEIFNSGQFVTDLIKKVAQYMAENPTSDVVTVVKVAKIITLEAGGVVVGTTVDIVVEGESWPQAVASQAGAWAGGGLVAIGVGALGVGPGIIAVASASAVYVFEGNKGHPPFFIILHSSSILGVLDVPLLRCY